MRISPSHALKTLLRDALGSAWRKSTLEKREAAQSYAKAIGGAREAAQAEAQAEARGQPATPLGAAQVLARASGSPAGLSSSEPRRALPCPDVPNPRRSHPHPTSPLPALPHCALISCIPPNRQA